MIICNKWVMLFKIKYLNLIEQKKFYNISEI